MKGAMSDIARLPRVRFGGGSACESGRRTALACAIGTQQNGSVGASAQFRHRHAQVRGDLASALFLVVAQAFGQSRLDDPDRSGIRRYPAIRFETSGRPGGN